MLIYELNFVLAKLIYQLNFSSFFFSTPFSAIAGKKNQKCLSRVSSSIADVMSSSSTKLSHQEICKCGSRAVRKTSWTEMNPGRRFATCSNIQGGEGCNFFEWIDPPMCYRSQQIIPGLLHRINVTKAELKRKREKERLLEAELKRKREKERLLEAELKRKREKERLLVFVLICSWVIIPFMLSKMMY